MTNCTEENNTGASSSTTPTEVSQDIPVFDIRMMNEVDDHSISVDEKGCFLYLILIMFMYVCQNLFFCLTVACQKRK